MNRQVLIAQMDREYPDRLLKRLGASAPGTLTVLGPIASLSRPMSAFLCSKETPGATILKAFDQAAAWRDSERCVISGFHSPLERQCLDILLRGTQPTVIALARGFSTLRLPATQRKALDDGRLTVISPFPQSEKRATASLAHQRNRIVAAMADEVVFGFAATGGSLSRLDEEIADWGLKPRRLYF